MESNTTDQLGLVFGGSAECLDLKRELSELFSMDPGPAKRARCDGVLITTESNDRHFDYQLLADVDRILQEACAVKGSASVWSGDCEGLEWQDKELIRELPNADQNSILDASHCSSSLAAVSSHDQSLVLVPVNREALIEYLEEVRTEPFCSESGVPCKLCPGRKYNRRHDLAVHIKTLHLHERPFACSKCDAEFKRKAHLETHIRTVHDRSQRFSCPYCPKHFTANSTKRKHIRTIHGTDIYD